MAIADLLVKPGHNPINEKRPETMDDEAQFGDQPPPLIAPEKPAVPMVPQAQLTPSQVAAQGELGDALATEPRPEVSFEDALEARWRTRNATTALGRMLSADHEAEHGVPATPVTWDKAYVDEVWKRWGGANGVPDENRDGYMEYVMDGRTNEEVNVRSQQYMRSLEDAQLLSDETFGSSLASGTANLVTDPVSAATLLMFTTVTAPAKLALVVGGLVATEESIIAADDPVATSQDVLVYTAVASTFGAGVGLVSNKIATGGRSWMTREVEELFDPGTTARLNDELVAYSAAPTTHAPIAPGQSKVAAAGKLDGNPVARQAEEADEADELVTLYRGESSTKQEGDVFKTDPKLDDGQTGGFYTTDKNAAGYFADSQPKGRVTEIQVTKAEAEAARQAYKDLPGGVKIDMPDAYFFAGRRTKAPVSRARLDKAEDDLQRILDDEADEMTGRFHEDEDGGAVGGGEGDDADNLVTPGPRAAPKSGGPARSVAARRAAEKELDAAQKAFDEQTSARAASDARVRAADDLKTVKSETTTGSKTLDNLPAKHDIKLASIKELRQIAKELGVKPGRSKETAVTAINKKLDDAAEAVADLKVRLGDVEDADAATKALLNPKTIKLADLKTAAVKLGVKIPEGCK